MCTRCRLGLEPVEPALYCSQEICVGEEGAAQSEQIDKKMYLRRWRRVRSGTLEAKLTLGEKRSIYFKRRRQKFKN